MSTEQAQKIMEHLNGLREQGFVVRDSEQSLRSPPRELDDILRDFQGGQNMDFDAWISWTMSF
jgi:hypothetical protein